MVDFCKFTVERIGIPLNDTNHKHNKKEFWKAVTRWMGDGKPFFVEMDPMVDAFMLWEYVKEYEPTILSAVGNIHVDVALREKTEWVRMHLGDNTAEKAILVRKAIDKALHAAPRHILIDDRSKAIDPWVEAGGIGILHTSAEDTIKQLMELGI